MKELFLLSLVQFTLVGFEHNIHFRLITTELTAVKQPVKDIAKTITEESIFELNAEKCIKVAHVVLQSVLLYELSP